MGADEISPQEIVEEAISCGCRSISYTYTEPTIFFEYAFDTAKIAKEKSLYNIFVTNGYMTSDALKMIRPYLDAANVDLKFFRDQSYKNVCSASLQPVLDSIKTMRSMDIWVEVTTLVVPGLNDSKEELGDIARFIAGVDANIPWHISRYHPDYKFNKEPPTPETTLVMAAQVGRDAGLNFVYVGNAAGVSDDTYCPMCKKLLIRRKGFDVYDYNIEDGKCASCATVVAGLFDR
jgi:pyruvate formate lyase activating enzyme